MTPRAEAGAVRAPVAGPPPADLSAAEAAEPNLGPPAARLDWRRR
jgi:hypothetical protein